MRAAQLCELREAFFAEWSRDYPGVPPPTLKEISELGKDCVIDESEASGYTIRVRNSLRAVEDKIDQLRGQLKRKEVVRRFLLSVLAILNGDRDRPISREVAGVNSDITASFEGVENEDLHEHTTASSTPVHACQFNVNERQSSDPVLPLKGKTTCVNISTITVGNFSGQTAGEFVYGRSRSRSNCESYNSEYKELNDNPSDRNQIYCNEDEISDVYNLTTDREQVTMFRKKKTSHTKHGEEDGGGSILGSRDNFLAVTSKRKIEAEGHRNDEVGTSSPSLTRNFHLLKLTHGFDLVLDDSSGSDSNSSALDSNRSADKPSRDDNDSSRRVPAKNSQGSDPIRQCKQDDIIASSSPPRANVSTVNVLGKGLYCEMKEDSTFSSEVQNESHLAQTREGEADPQDHHTERNKQEPIYNNAVVEATESDVSSDQGCRPVRQTSKKTSVPPPVAKKPLRPGSGKKLSPLPVGANLSQVSNFYSKLPSPTEIPTDFSSHKNSDALIANHYSDSDTSDIVGNRLSSFSTPGNQVPVSGLKDLKLRHWDEEEIKPKAKEEMDTQRLKDITVLTRPSGPARVAPMPPPLQQLPHLETSVVTKGVETNQGTKLENNKNLFPSSEGGGRRSSIETLIAGAHSSVVSVVSPSQQGHRGKSEEVVSDSWSEEPFLPPCPPRQSTKHCVNEAVAEEHAEEDSNTHFVRMESSDTLVYSSDRSESFSSDVDVKDALQFLDKVVNLERTNTLDHSSKKRLSSTPSYENWTINRALTSSITRRDFDSISDDEDTDTLSSSTTTSPCMRRQNSPTGSKDSGLCDELSTSDFSNFDHDLASGRIRDLKRFQQMADCEEEDDPVVTSDYKEQEKELDHRVSVASDIVFIHGPDSQEGHTHTEATGRAGHTKEDILRENAPEDDKESLDKFDSSSVASTECSGEDEEEEEEEASTTMDSSYDETSDTAREGILKMRQLLVKGVLDSEKSYLGILSILIDYKRNLEAAGGTSQPVISEEDVQSIFSNLEAVCAIHRDFVEALEPKVLTWTHNERIGEIFKIPVLKFEVFGTYLTNYQLAVNTIHRCSHESERFQEIAKEIVVRSTPREVTTLEDALFKPVQRIQRNTLVLHDLLKYTPEDHPDHEALQKALKLSQHNLEKFAENTPDTPATEENRRLVKSSFLVELVNGIRKLRYIFLFSDIIICTKRDTHRNNKVSFDIKWFTPLSLVSCDTKFAYSDDTKHSRREEIDEVKNKIRTLKRKMKDEMKKYDDKDKHRSLVNLGGASRTVEKLRKKITQYEGELILASPKLPFKVSLEGGRVYTMLMTTDYEREEWKETIASLSKKCPRSDQQQQFSSIFVQDLINSVKETPQVNKIGSVLLQKDEHMLHGTLNVTIHKMNGLTEDCDSYCCLEMDSFGHFFMKARTGICQGSRDPAWNEDFELELDGSQTLRVLCFKKQDRQHGDTLLGRGALELSKQWLKYSFQEKTVSMNEISVVISVRHTPSEKTMQRTPSRVSAAVFGVKIASCARREGKTVPTIVTACLREVEKRGLDEVGIYRVSGVTSDLQRIKKLFDRNVKLGAASLEDVDIHAVTGIVKLYFRELPEPLFTEVNYQRFIDTLKLSDDEAKSQCILSLLYELPDANYYTIVYLLEHLIKVARNVGENKMSIHNLSTIFGPTLLAPATKHTSSDPLEMMCKGAEQVMHQASVINYLLGLAVSGRSLRRSAQ